MPEGRLPERSEHELQCKFNLPARGAGLTHRSEVDRIDAVRWKTEIRMIEQIENLSTELQAETFGQNRVAKSAEVHVLYSIGTQAVAARIAIGIRSSRLDDAEGRRIEPTSGNRIRQHGISVR
jgi:hypothetical protein